MMLAKDIEDLNQHAIDGFSVSAPNLAVYIGDEDGEPDESRIWARFVINPSDNSLATIGNGKVYNQLGIATLQIMQPKNLPVAETDLGAWDIADIAMHIFRDFRGSEQQIEIYRCTPQRIPNGSYLQINLLIYYRSKHRT
ncbi:hypothetical protein [Sphingobium sp. KCTC 72723]|uniref:hypothetical protein n=1 Tax=Sphingobium sp. KCTC 72723 TaxID=2733867 RepID=UPI00165E2D64|nr:hypothetical protein [Sphingobium sp. KCTC 72723]